MKPFQLLLIICAFGMTGMVSCTGDKAGNGEEEGLETDAILDLLDGGIATDSATLDGGDAQTDNDENLSEEEKQKMEKHQEERKKIIAEQMEQSVNKGKDCDQVLKDYKALVDKILKDGITKHLEELNKWNNDPLYNACKKLDKYKPLFKELEDKMNEDEEEEDIY